MTNIRMTFQKTSCVFFTEEVLSTGLKSLKVKMLVNFIPY